MVRWTPDARERLEAAAFDLFEEHGYDATTVTQIAERAGLNRATFFRHFADKREVILAGENALVGVLAGAIRDADPAVGVYDCLRDALRAAEQIMTPQTRATAVRRAGVVAKNAELQERGALKLAHIASAISDALDERGSDPLESRLAGELVVLAFRLGFAEWLHRDDGAFAPHAITALDALLARAADLRTSHEV